MPIYEYVCRECGQKFEKLVLSRSTSNEVQCPKCGAKAADQQFSTFASCGSASESFSGGGCGAGGRFT